MDLDRESGERVGEGGNDYIVKRDVSLPRPGRGVLWLLAFFALYLVASMLFGIKAWFDSPGLDESVEQGSERVFEYMMSLDGIVGMYLLQFLIVLPAIVFASRFSTQSWRVTLAMKRVGIKTVALWVGVWVVYIAISAGIGSFVKIPNGEFVELLMGSRHLGFALLSVVLAPILEESLFGGYLFKAWRSSWLGGYGTILVTSVLFLALHAGQYNWFLMSQLFVFSIILGLAREKTGSLLVPLVVHALNNLLATVSLVYFTMEW